MRAHDVNFKREIDGYWAAQRTCTEWLVDAAMKAITKVTSVTKEQHERLETKIYDVIDEVLL